MVTLTVPPEYGYVVLTSVGTCFLGWWHGIRVTGFRKAAGPAVTYPAPFADSAQMSAASPDAKKKMHIFNCAQRAHGNYNENHPSFLVALLIAGLRYPVASTILGLGWSVSRIAFAVGYTNPNKENGKGRLIGLPFWLFQLAVYSLAAMTGYKIAF